MKRLITATFLLAASALPMAAQTTPCGKGQTCFVGGGGQGGFGGHQQFTNDFGASSQDVRFSGGGGAKGGGHHLQIDSFVGGTLVGTAECWGGGGVGGSGEHCDVE